jgi:hypothetical protein
MRLGGFQNDVDAEPKFGMTRCGDIAHAPSVQKSFWFFAGGQPFSETEQPSLA